MRRLFVILLLLCTWVILPTLQAQMYTTSSASYHSYSTIGVATPPSTASFRSTSVYREYGSTALNTSSTSYSTAPMRVATGGISTIASQLAGGVLAEENKMIDNGLRGPRKGPGSGGIAPPDTPIGDGWDVAVFLLLLCVGYALYLTRKTRQKKAKA